MKIPLYHIDFIATHCKIWDMRLYCSVLRLTDTSGKHKSYFINGSHMEKIDMRHELDIYLASIFSGSSW